MRIDSSQSSWKLFPLLGLCALLVVWIGACGGDSGPTDPGQVAPPGDSGPPPDGGGDAADPNDPSDPDNGAMGSLRLSMTDDPTDEICELWVYIRDIRVKPDGQSQQMLELSESFVREWEILQLREGPPAVLGDFEVPQGRYQFIEILLDQSQSYVIEREDPQDPASLCLFDTPAAVQIPSQKIKVNGGPFDVDALTAITIDFDARKSLKRKGGGNGNGNNRDKGWQLKPVISIVEVVP